MNKDSHKANEEMSLRIIPKLEELVADPAKISTLPPEVIPPLRGELAKVDTLLQMRVATARSDDNFDTEQSDKWLTAEEAAPMLGVTPRWLYRHAPQLPFARRLSRKVLRFSEAGIRKWQKQKRH